MVAGFAELIDPLRTRGATSKLLGIQVGCLTLLIFAAPASEGAGRAAPYFAFRNNFWMNLHQALFHEADLGKLPPEERARVDPSSLLDAPLNATSGTRPSSTTPINLSDAPRSSMTSLQRSARL
jgi:hypothetical protein